MYKLMIAEDEALARDAIMRMIDFAAYGFEVVAVCEDGQQAFEAYTRQKPDLVITDINMPFVSGLELAARIDAAGLGTRVIIITGYDDFNYARQAIRSKVASYVLKPVTPDEFREVLQEARKALDEQVARLQLIRDTQRTIHRQNPLVRDQILNRIVQGAADIGEVAADLRTFGIDPDRMAFLLSLVQIDQPQQAAQSLNVNEQLLRFMVLNVCEELAQDVPGFMAFVMPDGTAALIVIAARRDADRLLVQVSDNGVGFNPADGSAAPKASADPDSQHGLGLANVDDRIRLFFGAGYGLTIESAPSGSILPDSAEADGLRTRVILTLPLIDA